MQYALRDDRLPTRREVRRWLKACAPGCAQVTVRFVDREEGRSLNARYRGKDYPTNVLSFPYAPPPQLAGDMVVCAPVVETEAAAAGRALEVHFAHLVVHGMLHLQGYDHENDKDAAVMEAAEREVMARLGYPDPYDGEE